jgi:MYXO-CTERM domain-containing protein
MRLAAGLLVILPAAAAVAAPIPREHACMGPWTGVGDEGGDTVPWTIRLNMTASASGGRCGTIEYESSELHCGGTLDDCELIGEDIHTREVYTFGQSTCAPPSKVVIRCEGDRMRFSWVGHIRVDTMLRRPDGYVDPNLAPRATDPAPVPPKTPAKKRALEPSTKKGCSCAAGGGGDGATGAIAIVLALWIAARRR